MTTTMRGRPRVSDAEILHRVIAVMIESGRSMSAQSLRAEVRGEATRVDQARRTLEKARWLLPAGIGYALNVGGMVAAGVLRRTEDGYQLTSAGYRVLRGGSP